MKYIRLQHSLRALVSAVLLVSSLNTYAVERPTVLNCANFVKHAQSAANKMTTSNLSWLTGSEHQDEKQLAKSVVHALVKAFGMYPEVAVEAVSRSCAANKI